MVLGDIIEHVTNPEEVLVASSSRIGKNGELIVTTANAFHLYGFLRALTGGECTHPDHVAYYSPMNLMELFSRSGLQIIEMRGYVEDAYRENPLKRLVRHTERACMALFPGTSCGIICRAKRIGVVPVQRAADG
mgnify:FL=1